MPRQKEINKSPLVRFGTVSISEADGHTTELSENLYSRQGHIGFN